MAWTKIVYGQEPLVYVRLLKGMVQFSHLTTLVKELLFVCWFWRYQRS